MWVREERVFAARTGTEAQSGCEGDKDKEELARRGAVWTDPGFIESVDILSRVYSVALVFFFFSTVLNYYLS